MGNIAGIVLTMALLAVNTGTGLAQGSTSTGQVVPDSNMASPSGNTGEANNGIGQQGSLTSNAGSHSSNLTGAAAAAQIPTNTKAVDHSHNDPAVEKDPAQGGGQQR